MTERHSYPLFARVYTRVAEISERRGASEHRRKLLAGLSGRVIEVGAGSGANFHHYPTSVEQVVAIEPESYLRERAREAAAHASVPISVQSGNAEQLEEQPMTFDAAVAALVLCTVPDQRRALAELHRVIRPGGELRFYEHVVSKSGWQASIQRLADATFWPRLAGGCHLARDTQAAIERSGFQIQALKRFPFSPAPFLAPDPHILGVALRT